MKRFSFFIVLVVTVVAITLASAEGHPLATDFSNIQENLYLENGNIVYSKYDGNSDIPDAYRTVSKIICVDNIGNQVWECKIPTFTGSAFAGLIQTNEGNFVYVRKRNNDLYSLLTLSESGKLIDEYTFPEKIYTPYLLSDGVVYLASEERIIKKRFWDGTIVSPEPQKSFDRFDRAETIENRTYVSAIVNHENFLLCIDEMGKEIWELDLGDSNDIFIQAWVPSGNDGVVIASQTGAPDPDTPICLMEINNGEKRWETPFRWPDESIRMQLLLPNKENGYDLYGRINDKQGFCLSFSKEGEITTCFTVNVPIVQFVQYNGSVYAVGYSTDETYPHFFPCFLMDYNLLQKQSFSCQFR